MTLIAQQQGRYVYQPNSVLVEVDWDKETANVNHEDRKNYHARAMHGFDGRVTDPVLKKIFG